MANKKAGYVYLIISKNTDIVKLGICKEIDDKLREQCEAWYGRNIQIVTFNCENKKRLKQKFQYTFKYQMLMPCLFIKNNLQDYLEFLAKAINKPTPKELAMKEIDSKLENMTIDG